MYGRAATNGSIAVTVFVLIPRDIRLNGSCNCATWNRELSPARSAPYLCVYVLPNPTFPNDYRWFLLLVSLPILQQFYITSPGEYFTFCSLTSNAWQRTYRGAAINCLVTTQPGQATRTIPTYNPTPLPLY